MNKNWKNQARCSICKKWIKGGGLMWQLAYPHKCKELSVHTSIPNIERIKEHFRNIFFENNIEVEEIECNKTKSLQQI